MHRNHPQCKSQVTYIYRQVSPIVVRTIERSKNFAINKVPIHITRSPSSDIHSNDADYWRGKYHELLLQYNKLEEQHLRQSTRLKESEYKQISDMLERSQNEVCELKQCLTSVDQRLNEDYQQKFLKANEQLIEITQKYDSLSKNIQNGSNQDQLKKCYETIEKQNQSIKKYQEQLLAYQNRIEQIQNQNNKHIEQNNLDKQQLLNDIDRLQKIIQEQNLEIENLQLRYSEQFNIGTKMQEQLSLIALCWAEIQSLRSLVIDKDKEIEKIRNQMLENYKN
ncbi:hypothetical protein pb186bvf_012148 [Paramecium bursaria]